MTLHYGLKFSQIDTEKEESPAGATHGGVR
jgi:hypothetical protein